MRVASIRHAGERRVGIVSEDGQSIAPVALSMEEAEHGVLALIGKDPTTLATLSPLPLSEVEVEAPFPRPCRNIFCVGKNYHAHAREFSRSGFDSSAAQSEVPAHPIIFSKVPETVIASGMPVIIDPKISDAIDYEAELAVIIGKGGRGIRAEDAMEHVWGYTIINDVTARDLQGKYSQWLIGKSQDTFCPMGPFAVTADEIDISDTAVTSWGEWRDAPKRQHTRPDLRRTDHYRDDFCWCDAQARRHHCDRNAGRRGYRFQAAKIPARRRRGSSRPFPALVHSENRFSERRP